MQPSVVRRRRVGSLVLAVTLLATGTVLAAWKHNRLAAERSSTQPEPVEAVTVATATPREHRETTTAIGTVLALESITLRNELAGTVRHVSLTPGAIVEAGTVLVALDMSVEAADLRALQAQAALAETTLRRHVYLRQHEANAEAEVDQARAQRDVTLAQVERLKATIAKKIIRAPFRARVGLADVHVGQYLNEGVQLTTLQGVDERGERGLLRSPERRREPGAWGDGGHRHRRRGGADRRADRGDRRAGGPRDAQRDGPRPDLRRPTSCRRPARRCGSRCRSVRRAPRWRVPASALSEGSRRRPRVRARRGRRRGKLRAHERAVASGPVVGDEVLILKGLKPGEQVAASGSFKLREAR